MFTGIIEVLGRIESVSEAGTNRVFWLSSPISQELKVDQSVSHSGVCLTVEEIKDNRYRVTAIEETLHKTNVGSWQQGDLVNLERCLTFNGRLDGHIVQGHVDATAECIDKQDRNGSYEYRFQFPDKFAGLVIEKGSISLNGISLTIFNVGRNEFSVAIIPYTFEHTNIQHILPGNKVNIEFDMVGKYVERIFKVRTDQ
ncbi:riboflavin synthase [Paraflavitalea sp. CAU 1676]|uniref:riboflavin synthase n=1 Tax=Paraflavitalea sp. CAU 1676 TaxID=3032598 RepID=UPI0023DC68F1|nr:riboflavin synthase [Paraflavitalea sp. CAU 1676]MDF2189779.1 riboflavin synthase [Paraflavitalea sp. CAU 1676]